MASISQLRQPNIETAFSPSERRKVASVRISGYRAASWPFELDRDLTATITNFSNAFDKMRDETDDRVAGGRALTVEKRAEQPAVATLTRAAQGQ